MIQKWIAEKMKEIVPGLEWTYDFKTGDDHTGVVYAEDTGTPTQDDFTMMFPSYTIYIETSDMDNADVMSWAVHDALDKRREEIAVINEGISFHVIFISVIGPPITVSIKNKKITYSINLQTTLRRA